MPFLFILTTSVPAAEFDRSKVVAVYLYRLAEHVQWPNEAGIVQYHLHIIDAKRQVASNLKGIAQIKKLHGKSFRVTRSSESQIPSGAHLVYISGEYAKEYPTLFKQSSTGHALLVSDNMGDKRITMINLLNTDEKEIRFEINKANVINQNLGINPDIILLGGTEIDVAKLYRQAQTSLQQQEQQLVDLKLKRKTLQNEISQARNDSEALEATLTEQRTTLESEREQARNESDTLKAKLTQQREKLESEINEARKVSDAISKKLTHQRKMLESELNQARNDTDTLRTNLTQQLTVLEGEISQARNDSEVMAAKLTDQKSLLEQQLKDINRLDGLLVEERSRYNSLNVRVRQREEALEVLTLSVQQRELALEQQAIEIKSRATILDQQDEKIAELDVVLSSQSEIIGRQQYFLYLATALVLLLFVFIVFVFKSSRAKQRINSQLQIQQERLTEHARVIKESERILKESQHVAKLGRWELNLQSKQLDWTDELFNIFEINNEKLTVTYDDFLSTIHPDDRERVSATHEGSIKDRKPYEIIHRLMMKDGRVKYVRELCRTEYADDGTALCSFGTVQDITTLKVVENQLLNTNKQLREAKQAADTASLAKSTFLANMSHELRTPLNAILGFSQLLQTDPKTLPAHNEDLKIINSSGQHLLQLINDVLDMSKIEAGHVSLELEDFDLGALVNDVIDMMLARAEEKGLHLSFDQSSEFPRFIHGDPGKLRQILTNLFSNAIKFTDSGSVILKLGSDNNHPDIFVLYCEVRDTGCGIAPENIERVFMPFEQLIESSSQKGTGLGLSITRQFVEMMGGEITAESELGVGSVFRFSLQVQHALEDMEIQPSDERGRFIGLKADQPECRVLIAEDQQEAQMLLQRLLEKAGFTVKIAKHGKEAVELFQSWHPHFIWMDWRMPVMDGVQATGIIRQLPGGKDVKISALTASVFKEQEAEVMKAEMDDFVRKPYHSEEIFNCMAKHLDLDYNYLE